MFVMFGFLLFLTLPVLAQDNPIKDADEILAEAGARFDAAAADLKNAEPEKFAQATADFQAALNSLNRAKRVRAALGNIQTALGNQPPPAPRKSQGRVLPAPQKPSQQPAQPDRPQVPNNQPKPDTPHVEAGEVVPVNADALKPAEAKPASPASQGPGQGQ